VGMQQPLQTIAPGQTVDVQARLFAGPEEEQMLAGVAPGLELVKDYGMVTIIAKPLFWLLGKIHGVVGNWGWAIILLTLLIKAVMLGFDGFWQRRDRGRKCLSSVGEFPPPVING